MKKAEIIKNGNVNLNPIKTGIDWEKIDVDFQNSRVYDHLRNGYPVSNYHISRWFRDRIEKELNSSE